MITTARRQSSSQLDEFYTDVVKGLSAPQKTLPCKYFYDAVGSELFEMITELPEYYPTRVERSIMDQHVAEMAALMGPQCLLVEYGSGSIAKTRLLLDHLELPVGYVPIDVAAAQLSQASAELAADYPQLEILPLCADFTAPLRLPSPLHRPRRRVVYFPGSTIGNLDYPAAVALLRQTARLCGREGGMLLGVDMQKDPRVLEAAYNDRRGITAQFNLNILHRINRELNADFNVNQFVHQAYYNTGLGRVEMHLVSQKEQTVRIRNKLVNFQLGESIHTESSYKYTPQRLAQLADAGGFRTVHTWTDRDHYFSVVYLAVR